MSQIKNGEGMMLGKSYKIIKPLFQVRSYLYAQICCIDQNYKIVNAALYLFENQDPSLSLRMLAEKLSYNQKYQISNLIFPYHHQKQSFNDKQIAIYLIHESLLPLRFYEKKAFGSQQILELLHGALSSLNQIHVRNIVHGNISLSTCYIEKYKNDKNCKFALNILDTVYFTEEDCQQIQEKLFASQGQCMGRQSTFKDDLQSIIYVLAHLLSKGKLFTIQRFQLQWITQAEILRWKSCDFFRELNHIVPPELQILIQIYTVAKSLNRLQKPDYAKLMKKIGDQIVCLSRKQTLKSQSQNKKQKGIFQQKKYDSIKENDVKLRVDQLDDEEIIKPIEIKQSLSNSHYRSSKLQLFGF